MTSVRLIAITTPVIPEIASTADVIAYCARVSNPSNQANTLTAPKLLRYLYKNRHWSPFEMASMTMEVVTTRDIARQILRHRSFSFQEFSQRYAEVVAEPVYKEARLQDTQNRQNSLETADEELKQWWLESQLDVASHASTVYQAALRRGIAKEQARAVLPEGLTPSTLYMAGTIRSWLHFIDVRSGNGTQKEHQAVALQSQQIVLERYPTLADIWVQ